MLKKLLIAAFAFLVMSCPNHWINSWYEMDEDTRPVGPVPSDTCDILLYHFTDPVSIGSMGGGSGDAGDPVLIAIGYPEGSTIPYDGGIKIFHNGKTVEPAGPWDDGVRDYVVTAESGRQKHYRVTASKDLNMTIPAANTNDIILYYFTKPGTEELLSIGKIGAAGDPVLITISYPEGTSFPVAEGDIRVYHNGESVEPEDTEWDYTGGVFVRNYRVTAGNKAVKHYRVVASKENSAPAPVSDTCDLLLYYFEDPACVGIPDPAHPENITITLPAGTDIPADGNIKVLHNGAGGIEWGGWGVNGVREYTVTAGTGKQKTYRVTAVMGTQQAVPPAEACDILLYYFRVPGTEPPQMLSKGKLILEGRSGTTEKDAFFIEISYPAETAVSAPPSADIDIIHLASPGSTVTWGAWENDGETRVRLYTVKAELGQVKYYQVRAAKDAPAGTPVTGVKLSSPSFIFVPGGSMTLTCEVQPPNATIQTVMWSSSDKEVAGVSSSGKVTANKVGTAAIIATTVDGGYTDVCIVTVSIPVTGISVTTPGGLSIAVGESAVLKAAVTPDSADQTVRWESANDKIVSVDAKTGLITGQAVGQAKITASSGADPKKTAVCEVTVTPRVTGVIIRKDTVTIETLNLEPNAEVTLNALVTQEGASQSVSWGSSDNAIVAPADKTSGKFKAGSKLGTAVITVTTDAGGYKATCIVTVGVKVESVSLAPAVITLEPEGHVDLTATVTPANAGNRTLIWASSDTSVATVAQDTTGTLTNGQAKMRVTAMPGAGAVGTTIITVSTADGGFAAVCVVTVSITVTGISVTPPGGLSIAVGESAVLKAAVTPPEADQTVTWASASPAIATVDAKTGLVTGKAEGKATITASSGADPKKTAECEVTVTPRVTGVIIRKDGVTIETLNLEPNDEVTLNALVTEPGASQAVSWDSSENAIVAEVAGTPGKFKAGSTLGTAVITVMTDAGGYKATCVVTVGVKVKIVKLLPASVILSPGESTDLTATVTPANAGNRTLNWASSNPLYADVATGTTTTLDADGKVTMQVTAKSGAAAVGTTIITVSTADGGFTAACQVTVRIQVASVALTGITLNVGQSGALIPAITPNPATPTPATITETAWAIVPSSPAGVVQLDTKTGWVTGLKAGTALIRVTVKTVDSVQKGITATATATVTVKALPLSSECAILAYDFVNPDSVGTIGGGYGTKASPIEISIIPAADGATLAGWENFAKPVPENGDIRIAWIGKELKLIEQDGSEADTVIGTDTAWDQLGSGSAKGPFTRLYRVEAPNGDYKYYRVSASPSLDIHNLTEWNQAMGFISNVVDGTAGSPQTFRPNIVDIFSITNPPDVSTITGNHKTVRMTATQGPQTISLDTNNGSLLRTAPNQTFVIEGDITLQGKTGNNAALVHINGGAVELLNGAIKSNENTSGTGGGVDVAAGTFTMSGSAVISQNKALNGGGVYVRSGGSFTMSGGAAISGNTTDGGSAGGVFVDSGGSFTMSGSAAISGNTPTTAGGGVFVNGGSFTMSGSAAISGNTPTTAGGGVFVNGGSFTMSGSAAISGNKATNGGGVFVENGTFEMSGSAAISENAANSSGSNGGGGVFVKDGTFTMSGSAAISGNTANGSASGTGGGGVYVAGGEFTMSGGTIGGDSTANLGNMATHATYGNGGGVYVSGGTFKMTESAAAISGNTAAVNGGGVYVASAGTFQMTNGTIGGDSDANLGNTANSSTGGGGGVVVNGGSFTMSAGSVSGNTAVYAGGGVLVTGSGGTFGLSGGTIGGDSNANLGNTATSGGGVAVQTGTVTMSSPAVIAGNEATGANTGGGGVYVYPNGSFTMNSGTIGGASTSGLGNTANTGGGVFVISTGTFTMGTSSSTAAYIRGNKALAGHGGGVYNDGKFEMINGTIGGTTTGYLNTATGSGGGVYITGTTTAAFTMSGGTINSNTATGPGGGVYNGNIFTMSNGTISGNMTDSDSASTYGGGVYTATGKFEMQDGTISGNTASASVPNYSYGGGVYAASGTFEMTGGTIGGTAAGSANAANAGGGVCVAAGTFTMTGSTSTTVISGNTAYNNGGGVYVESNGSFTMTGGTIGGTAAGSPNKANQSGGGVYIINGIFDKTGGIISGNTATAINGQAVMLSKSGSYYRNADLGATDDISSSNLTIAPNGPWNQ